MQKSTSFGLIIGFFFVLLFLAPYALYWDDSYITIHDNLDGVFILPTLISGQHVIGDFDSSVALMDGIRRASFPMTYPWEIKPLINFLIPGYGGYFINYLLVAFLAFTGMWLLLVNYVSNNKYLAFFVALVYSQIPFYVEFGISSAGIPLLIYALLNFREKKKVIISYVIVVFYSLYSSFALVGLFVCALLFVWNIVSFYDKRKIDKHLAASLIILSLLYVSTNWALIQDFFVGTDFVSHRIEWKLNPSIKNVLKDLIFDAIVISQYHAGTFCAFPIVFVFIIVYLVYKKNDSTLKFFLVSYIILVLLITLGTFTKLLPVKLFQSFQFDRFCFLYPALCFILLGKACDVLWEHKKTNLCIGIVLMAMVCVGVFNKEYIKTLIKPFGYVANMPTFSQFYDEALYKEIASDIKAPQDYSVKVVSVGMYPAVASYNGFWSLDGYMSSYSLDYKHKFREVISKELKKDDAIKHYFDDWGSRCYIFSSELGKNYLFSKKDQVIVSNLEINTEALKRLGCMFVFSAVDILNYKENKLEYINSYTTEKSYYNIRVYKLK